MIKARTFDQVSAERAEAEPTPETDAAEERRPTWIPDVVQVGSVPVGFARSLERERNKLRAAIRALLEDYDCKNEVMPAYYQALDALGEKK